MEKKPDIQVAAVCGLFCPSCGVYIATQENDEAKLIYYASRLGQTIEDTKCDGCRSGRVSAQCRLCEFRSCSEKKGILFCSECDEFPCESLKEFQTKMPHRLELWESLELVKTEGLQKWWAKMAEDYTCPECGVINSSYDIKCAKCHHKPGNKTVERNMQTIEDFFANLKKD